MRPFLHLAKRLCKSVMYCNRLDYMLLIAVQLYLSMLYLFTHIVEIVAVVC